jgi:hypothetical protein
MPPKQQQLFDLEPVEQLHHRSLFNGAHSVLRPRLTRCATLALTIWTLACTSHRPVAQGVPLPVGRTVRVRSAEPFILRQPGYPATVCRSTSLSGEVRRMIGDTLIVEHSRDMSAAPDADGRAGTCPTNQVLGVMLAPSMEVTEHRLDRGRTTVLILGLAAALIGFAAYAASNMEYTF